MTGRPVLAVATLAWVLGSMVMPFVVFRDLVHRDDSDTVAWTIGMLTLVALPLGLIAWTMRRSEAKDTRP